jgi:hypothetical protein
MKKLLSLFLFFSFIVPVSAFEIKTIQSNSLCPRACYNSNTDIVYFTELATVPEKIHEVGHSLIKDTIPRCKSFVSAYGRVSASKGDFWEESADAITLFVIGGETFREMAKTDLCYRKKYNFIKNIMGKEYSGIIKYGYSVTHIED